MPAFDEVFGMLEDMVDLERPDMDDLDNRIEHIQQIKKTLVRHTQILHLAHHKIEAIERRMKEIEERLATLEPAPSAPSEEAE